MSIFKRGRTWSYSFYFRGEHVQLSTGLRSRTKAKEAEQQKRDELRAEYAEREKKARTSGCDAQDLRRCAECEKLFRATPAQIETDAKAPLLCSGECDDRWRKRQAPTPTLAEFLEKKFLPFVETTHATRLSTLRYYKTGTKSLLTAAVASIRLDKITNQDAVHYAASLPKKLSASTVNCGVRTLRRAVYLACEWGVIDRRPQIKLVAGERQRERILSDSEINVYLAHCSQPWKSVAIILLGTGCRPGEIFALDWRDVKLEDSKGAIQIIKGKSRAARRALPMLAPVYTVFKARYTDCGKPDRGWVFPAETPSGHLEGYCAKNQHAAALRAIRENAEEAGIKNPVRPFPPYCMRHTALTRLAEAGCDTFTLAKIAGHSSITITQRYVHQTEDAVNRAFEKVSPLALPT